MKLILKGIAYCESQMGLASKLENHTHSQIMQTSSPSMSIEENKIHTLSDLKRERGRAKLIHSFFPNSLIIRHSVTNEKSVGPRELL